MVLSHTFIVSLIIFTSLSHLFIPVVSSCFLFRSLITLSIYTLLVRSLLAKFSFMSVWITEPSFPHFQPLTALTVTRYLFLRDLIMFLPCSFSTAAAGHGTESCVDRPHSCPANFLHTLLMEEESNAWGHVLGNESAWRWISKSRDDLGDVFNWL